MSTILNVHARGLALVPVIEAINASPRRFVGRTFDPSLGQLGGYPVSREPTKVPVCSESHPLYSEFWNYYYIALKNNELWPADLDTAKACNVDFDQNFGGEYSAHNPSSVVPSTQSAVKGDSKNGKE